MKESKIGVGQNQVSRDLDQLEKMRRAERAERASELEKNLNAGLRFDEDGDLLGLDAPIVINNRNGNGQEFGGDHIRISNGEIVEGRTGGERRAKDSRRGIDDPSGDLSSIPSYDRGAGRDNRGLEGRQEGSHLGTDLEELRMLNEAEGLGLGDFDLGIDGELEGLDRGASRTGRDQEDFARGGAQ